MATLKPAGAVSTEIRFTVTEEEARALDALVGYGFDGFIKVFYRHMGRHYMEPHEAGLKSFFEAVRREIPTILARADLARAAFNTRDMSAAHMALRALNEVREHIRPDRPAEAVVSAPSTRPENASSKQPVVDRSAAPTASGGAGGSVSETLRDDAQCRCVGTFGPDPECGACGGSGCVSTGDAR